MDREKAIEVIKEICDRCGCIEGKSIKLMPPNANSVLSKGCQIHIKVNSDDLLKSCLITVVRNNCLAIKEEGAFLIIYNPQRV